MMPGAVRQTGALTPRERQIVQHLADGLAPKQIGPRLGIEHGTVRNLIVYARQHLGAASTEQLVALALRAGQIS